MGKRVLVTRPEPGASRTAEKLRLAGYSPVVMPLSRIATVTPADLPDGQFDAVAVTSANAISHAPASLIRALAHLPCHCVGPSTAQAAKEAGFGDVIAGSGDAGDLAGALTGLLPAGSRVAYLTGRKRRPAIEALLRSAGLAVDVFETYRTLPLAPDPAVLAEAGPVDAVLFHSAFPAGVLADLADSGRIGKMLDKPVFIAISERVAGVVAKRLNARCVATEYPDEDAMLGLLDREMKI